MPPLSKKYKVTWDKDFFVRGDVVKSGDTVELTEQEAAVLYGRTKTVVDKKTNVAKTIRMVEPVDGVPPGKLLK